jgi:hypothetical protein
LFNDILMNYNYTSWESNLCREMHHKLKTTQNMRID